MLAFDYYLKCTISVAGLITICALEDNSCFPIVFGVFICLLYSLSRDKRVLNPQNIVFAFYFLWYVLAPCFADRYALLGESIAEIKLAYIMFYMSYLVAYFSLDYAKNIFVGGCVLESTIESKEYLTLKGYYVFLLIYLIGLIFYVLNTGGIELWLSDPNSAFFNRRGSGYLYILFEFSALVILYYHKNTKLFSSIIYLVFICITMFFCGSRSLAILFLAVFFADKLIMIRVFSAKNFCFVLASLSIFLLGMYIRERAYVASFSALFSISLNYFDTLDEFLLLLNDFQPDFFKTLFFPINWILQKIGIGSNVDLYDTSIWLTTIYYPESWNAGGTHQWPIEAYLFLNFYFIFGLPFLALYFICIGKLYYLACRYSGYWRLIYINEMISIISHLRGGLFNYWYIYLIPIYIILYYILNNKFENGGKEIVLVEKIYSSKSY